MNIQDILYNIAIYPFEFLIETIYFLFGTTPLENKFIIVGVLINIIALPLYNVADVWQKRELDLQKKFKPKIDEIKSVFSGDKKQMLIQTFYRINNYHPIYSLRRLFGLLMQVPIFIAAYHFITNLDILSISSFGMIGDLSKSDGLIKIGSVVINLLPILMTVFNVLSSLIHTRELTNRERLPLFVMAGLFLVILYNSPSALLIYWTTTNLFSLIKNLILLKSKEIKKILAKTKKVWIILSIVWLISPLPFILKLIKPGNDTYRIIIPGIIIISLLYLYKFITSDKFFKNSKADFRLFLLSSLTLAILMGLFIPSSLIASSPSEFEETYNLLAFTLARIFGIVFLYPFFFFLIFGERIKKFLSFIFPFLIVCALFNTFLFAGNYGTLTDTLIFDNSNLLIPSFRENVLNVMLFVFIFISISLIIRKKKNNLVFSVMCIVLMSLTVSSFISFSKIIEYHKLNNHIIKNVASKPEKKVIKLSKTGDNVIVLFFDRALGFYVPDILEKHPEIKNELTGFEWYPETLSFFNYTYASISSILGGYDYTPFAMNKRSNETIAEKYTQANLVIPKILSSKNNISTIIKPTYPSWLYETNKSVFDSIENTKLYIQPFEINENELSILGYNKLEHYNNIFFRMPIFRVFPMFARYNFYDNGSWSTIYSYTKLSHGIKEYIYLISMTNMVDIIDNSNTYTFIGNDVTHEPNEFNSSLTVSYERVLADRDDIEKYGGNLLAKSIYANTIMFRELANFVKYLKENNVYNNTKIIVVSDHGRLFGEYHKVFEYYTEMENKDESIHALQAFLMIKDFNKTNDFITNNNFMTIADVPSIVSSHLTSSSNILNPFTGNKIKNENKNDGIYSTIGDNRFDKHGRNQFNFERVFHVKPSVFNSSNWQEIPKEKWSEIINNE